MEQVKTNITVHGKKHPCIYWQFESIDAALDYLSDERALDFINYSWQLIQRGERRTQILSKEENLADRLHAEVVREIARAEQEDGLLINAEEAEARLERRKGEVK